MRRLKWDEECWRLNPETGCMEWYRSVLPNGYGRTSRHGKMILAHRAAWEREHGPVPEGLCVLHRCDNRCCVNPDHLFLGTKKDNTHDMLAKRRWTPPMLRLRECEVEEIRRLRQLGVSLDVSARMFRCSASNISGIARGRRRAGPRWAA
jgi:hypothetical protein